MNFPSNFMDPKEPLMRVVFGEVRRCPWSDDHGLMIMVFVVLVAFGF